MENEPVNSAGTAQGTEAATAVPQLEQLASQLAAKHAAASNGARRGGRKTAQEETADFLSRNGLRAVPIDAGGDPGGTASDDPSGYTAGGPAFERSYVVTPDFVKTCADTLLRGIEAYRKRQVFLLVQKLSPPLAQQFSEEAGAPPGAIEVMSLCSAELAQKYDAFAKCGPEALLCVAACVWIGKDMALHKKLAELSRLKRTAEPQTIASNG